LYCKARDRANEERERERERKKREKERREMAGDKGEEES